VRFRRTTTSTDEETREAYKIEVLSTCVPVYPFGEENRWESMSAWWGKVNELFFATKEVEMGFREKVENIEITF
jgi:hypothetical protein